MVPGNRIMTFKSCAIVVGLTAAAIGVACDDDGPTMPTGTTVVVYQDTNYRGDSRVLIGNQPDLDDLPGCGGAGADWDDCISSIRIPSGWELTVFEHDDYEGVTTTFTADVPLRQRLGRLYFVDSGPTALDTFSISWSNV